MRRESAAGAEGGLNTDENSEIALCELVFVYLCGPVPRVEPRLSPLASAPHQHDKQPALVWSLLPELERDEAAQRAGGGVREEGGLPRPFSSLGTSRRNFLSTQSVLRKLYCLFWPPLFGADLGLLSPTPGLPWN